MNEDGASSLPKVLIVDDSRMVRASLIKHIRGRFRVREEVDGEAGWQALVVDPSIEMVLTDIGMPRLDGYGLLERIRSSKLTRLQLIPIVVISGDEDDVAREKARQLGANDFITKGISSTELLARLDSLWRLVKTQRELEASRAELAQQRSAESIAALHSDAPDQAETMLNVNVNWEGVQDAGDINRIQGNVSVMAIEIDQYADLISQYGANVAHLVVRKLTKILKAKCREDDTITQVTPQRLAVISSNADMAACCAFALLLQKAIAKLVMAYRDERIRVTISVGVASSAADTAVRSNDELVAVAGRRLEEGLRSGGNRVVSDQGEVTQKMVDRMMRHVVSIDEMLGRLRMGDSDFVAGRLPDIVTTILPLLDLVESQLRCGMPLEVLRAYQSANDAAARDK